MPRVEEKCVEMVKRWIGEESLMSCNGANSKFREKLSGQGWEEELWREGRYHREEKHKVGKGLSDGVCGCTV